MCSLSCGSVPGSIRSYADSPQQSWVVSSEKTSFHWLLWPLSGQSLPGRSEPWAGPHQSLANHNISQDTCSCFASWESLAFVAACVSLDFISWMTKSMKSGLVNFPKFLEWFPIFPKEVVWGHTPNRFTVTPPKHTRLRSLFPPQSPFSFWIRMVISLKDAHTFHKNQNKLYRTKKKARSQSPTACGDALWSPFLTSFFFFFLEWLCAKDDVILVYMSSLSSRA